MAHNCSVLGSTSTGKVVSAPTGLVCNREAATKYSLTTKAAHVASHTTSLSSQQLIGQHRSPLVRTAALVAPAQMQLDRSKPLDCVSFVAANAPGDGEPLCCTRTAQHCDLLSWAPSGGPC
jgi:hypothetical protein